MKKILFFITLFLILVGCGETTPTGNHSDSFHKTGVIISISEAKNGIFVEDKKNGNKNIEDFNDEDWSNVMNYSFKETTVIENENGDTLSINDLKVGQKVDVWTWDHIDINDGMPSSTAASRVIIID
ncbi:DUF3221 domain-containing protein [Evansella sp. AB-P1]|uniref:DUF3221 domain-containing protein n=1 Tax=Evansella sp. AB-P1 TaxID=3037653 RepID=UPI00241C6A4F|nr:DUF3221 domain-containing protein [Evansella sp. AB-P1]MDG5788752.1 DUF3221 domain-containing protein [Evansella sp. AB-P1]